MTGPKNAVVGDQDYGVGVPSTKIPESVLIEEKKMARYSRSGEFKRLKEYMEMRIKYYQHFLPDGKEIGINAQPTPEDWRVANRVIGEFNGILKEYENAQEVVEDESRRDS